MFPPERIVCLTEETVETLYLLGEDRRIVGVSGYAVRPARVRKEKPRVSAFISADFEKIIALEPDLVLTFSDLQADIAAELIRRNIAVHAFNQRDVAGIFDMIRTLGALVGATEKAEALAVALEDRLDAVREQAEALPRRPHGRARSIGAHRRRLGEPRQQRCQIVERLDQRGASADRVAWRQDDAALRRIERIERRMAEIVAALILRARRQVIEHDEVRTQREQPFERHITAIA